MNMHRAIAQELQHLFLLDGPADRHRRASRAMAQAARPRPALRPAGGLAKLRHRARQRLEAAPLPDQEWTPVRHAQRGDRPGLCDPQSAAAGGDGGAHRLGPRGPAAADRRRAAPAPAPLPFAAASISRRCARGMGEVVNGARHRRPQPPALPRHPDGRQDRHRPGPPHRAAASAARAATGAIATTACSSSSRRSQRRATPARW